MRIKLPRGRKQKKMIPPNTLHAGPNSSITEKQEAIGVYGSRGYLLEQSTQNIFEGLAV